MGDFLTALIWFAIVFLVLLLMQRWIHRHLQGVALLLTENVQWAVIIYALVLFPGVLLHETSHWLMATLLGVRTGRMSLLPKVQPGGQIQLGAVEYFKTDRVGAVRETLIGAAPLLFGTGALIAIGWLVFNLSAITTALQAASLGGLITASQILLQTNDVLVWLYLFFAIANAMMPSASDRRAWPVFFALVGGLALLALLLGLQETLMVRLLVPATTILGYLALAFTMTAVINIGFIGFIAVLEAILSRLRGKRVAYD